jgi:hypothetical protein
MKGGVSRISRSFILNVIQFSKKDFLNYPPGISRFPVLNHFLAAGNSSAGMQLNGFFVTCCTSRYGKS